MLMCLEWAATSHSRKHSLSHLLKLSQLQLTMQTVVFALALHAPMMT